MTIFPRRQLGFIFLADVPYILHIGNRASNDVDAELEPIQKLKPVANLETAS